MGSGGPPGLGPRLIRPDDLSRLDTAFTANAAVSALVAAGVALDLLI